MRAELAVPAGTAAELGRPGAFFEDADGLRVRATGFEEAAESLRRLDLGGWTGAAADAFGETLGLVRRALLQSADDSAAAAAHLERHGHVVAWALRELGEAAAAAKAAQRAAERAARVAAAATPGTAASRAGGGGPAGARVGDALPDRAMREAAAIASNAREAVERSAADTAKALLKLAESAPDLPTYADHIGFGWSQKWRGLLQGVGSMVDGVVKSNPLRVVIDPLGVAEDAMATGAALYAGVKDPVGFLKQATDYETWRTNPGLASARATPEIAVSAATAGMGGGGIIGPKVVSGLRKGAASVAKGAGPAKAAASVAKGAESVAKGAAPEAPAVTASRLNARAAAEKMVLEGHAFQKHVIDQKEFPEVRTKEDLVRIAETTIREGEGKDLPRGRTGFWKDDVLVVHDSKTAHGGSVYRPWNGYIAFLELD
ncbi:putative T7SS-secreted protein [Actinotalea subterranea]|uniref:putative T7SS-secreted protein n=1 Tax=Actinotalea subterranea TaxID=2607497 RepID=UPI0011EFD2C8|nr:hypothetical protein [Actinotalea subterranea]